MSPNERKGKIAVEGLKLGVGLKGHSRKGEMMNQNREKLEHGGKDGRIGAQTDERQKRSNSAEKTEAEKERRPSVNHPNQSKKTSFKNEPSPFVEESPLSNREGPST